MRMKSLVAKAILSVLATTSIVACSDSSERQLRPAPQAKQGDVNRNWSLKIFSGKGDQKKLVQIFPVQTKHENLSKAESLLKTKNFPIEKGTPEVGSLSQWQLLQGAAQECMQPRSPIFDETVTSIPWSDDWWFVFSNLPDNCDQLLAQQETMLCMADKLAQIGDAVAPIVWQRAGTIDNPSPWTIPVQEEKNKFIARDLAIYTLANLAFFDMSVIGGDYGGGSCTAKTASAAAFDSGSFDSSTFTKVFDAVPTNYYPPHVDNLAQYLENDLTNDELLEIRQGAKGRLVVKANVLRTSARLLKDLIEKSVAADMAGAAVLRAHATDPQAGGEIAWGVGERTDGYNSLAHAARVLLGRWELAPDGPVFGGLDAWSPDAYKIGTDKMCGGVGAEKILQTFYPHLRNRVEDRSALTEGQRLAVSFVETAGMVVPSAALQESAFATTRSAVERQLLTTLASRQGYQGDSEVDSFGQLYGKATLESFRSLPDGDLRFALEHSLRSYQLVGAQLEPVDDGTIAPLKSGLGSQGPQATSFEALGGISTGNPLPKNDFQVDVQASIGALQGASICNEPLGATEAQDWKGNTVILPLGAMADNGYSRVFQDSFSLGQVFRERLVVMREAWKILQLDSFNAPRQENAGDIAARAVADLFVAQQLSKGLPSREGLRRISS